MEEGLEDRVAEPEGEEVLHRVLAEVMIDPVDLVGPQELAEVAVELAGAGEIVAERLLDHDPRPGRILQPAKEADRRPRRS